MQNNKPLVSVIIATYNRAEYLENTIDSVLAQTYKNIEIIVIDDGSTDNTIAVLKQFFHAKQIKYIYQKNTGCWIARDNGIKKANGKYIAILDSDDYWFDKNKIKVQVKFLEKHLRYNLVGGWMKKFNKKGISRNICKYPLKDKDIRKTILFENPFSHSTVMYRKSAWKKVGGYCKISPCNDWHLWLKLGKTGKIFNLKRILTHYSTESNNISCINTHSKLKIDLAMRKQYRRKYPNFWKAYILSWISYYYYYFPFKERLYGTTQIIKKYIYDKF